METGAIFYGLGSLPFLVLGLIHAMYTVKDESTPRMFASKDPETLKRMQAESPRISPDTTLWRAGLGFHYSHSLGLVGAGLLFGGIALFAWKVVLVLPVLLWAGPVVGLIYLLLAVRYWFRIPAIGAGLGCGLMLAGAAIG